MAPRKDRYCFVHMPKCAGFSVLEFLQRAVGEANVLHAPSVSEQQRAPLDELLTRYQVLVGHYEMSTLPSWIFDCVFMFTFLRDPVDRVISNYEYYRNIHHKTLFPEILRAQSLELGQLLRETELARPNVWSNWQTYTLSGVRPIAFAPGKILAPAEETLRKFDFVGFYEQLTEDLRYLSQMCGWDPAIPLSAANVTPGRKKREELDPETIALIEELNRDDLALYEFAKALPRKTEHPTCAERSDGSVGPSPPFLAPDEHGTKEIMIESVTVRGRGSGNDILEQGDLLEIEIQGKSMIACSDFVAGIRINDPNGGEVYGINTLHLDGGLVIDQGQRFSFLFTCETRLAPALYYLTVAFHTVEGRNFHWLENYFTFVCVAPSKTNFSGRLDLKAKFETTLPRPPTDSALPHASSDHIAKS